MPGHVADAAAITDRTHCQWEDHAGAAGQTTTQMSDMCCTLGSDRHFDKTEARMLQEVSSKIQK